MVSHVKSGLDLRNAAIRQDPDRGCMYIKVCFACDSRCNIANLVGRCTKHHGSGAGAWRLGEKYTVYSTIVVHSCRIRELK